MDETAKAQAERARLQLAARAITRELESIAAQVSTRLNTHAAEVAAARRAGIEGKTVWSDVFVPTNQYRDNPLNHAALLLKAAEHLPDVVRHELEIAQREPAAKAAER